MSASASVDPVAVSIIVPAYDAAATIGACLDALAAQTGLPDRPELLVVDDGSRDATAAIVAAHPAGVGLLQQAHRGAAAARNRGAAAARGRVLLFTDADCRPRPDWAAEMLRPFAEDPGLAGVKGCFESDQPALLARFTQAEYAEKEARMLRHASVPFADTAAAGYRAEVLRAAGGFREDLRAVEDTELAFRLAAAGRRIVVAPRARVLHRHPERLRDYVRRKLRYGFWGAGTYLAHPARMADDARTPAAMRLQLALAPAIVVTGLLSLAAAAGLPAGRPWPGRLCLLGLLLFLISCLPFLARLREAGLALPLAAPGLLLLRALALDAGLAAGLLAGLVRPGSGARGGGR